MSATIKDIAAKLGISHSTVSRALSGHPYVNEELRRRVQETAQQLSYRPNALARGLKGMRTQLVGLILPDLMIDFYARAATIVQAALHAEGYRLLLSVSGNDPASELAYLRAMREERVEGLIWVPWSSNEKILREYSAEGVPVVQFGRRVSKELDAVLPDDREGARVGTEHLLSQGHRRVGLLVGSRALSSGEARLEGYLQALRGAGLEVDQALVKEGSFDRQWGRKATEELMALSDPPTALLAASSELVISALHVLHDRGITVPEEMSVVGFGDPDWYAIWRPEITTVGFATEAMARAAVGRLLERLRARSHGEQKGPVLSHLPLQLVVRESVTRPRRQEPMPAVRPGVEGC